MLVLLYLIYVAGWFRKMSFKGGIDFLYRELNIFLHILEINIADSPYLPENTSKLHLVML